ncbi:hypothetical protein JQM83_08785 [Parabacteroides distasonis]|nr:hypothetical protein [Parabacteroides distasonis]
MQIIDRYTGKILNDSNLPGDIELGRYAISMGSTYKELTSKSYKVQEGQRIHQELLDDVNTDKHNIFEIISESVENGDFRSIPLLQGIKNGLEFGDFATQMEEDFKHIEAIFHAPYSKLNRTIEKVPVSRAKRISNRSNQYLAAHTEDWLHKGLVSFRPSRILTEEIISDENVFENQLLIALVTRAAHLLERKLRYTRDITEFLIEYSKLIEKHEKSEDCWYKKVRRELSLAGKVYDEQSGNYKAANADIQIVTSTMKRLKKLRDSLLKLRQYDLFYNVDQRLVKSVQYHDTNVLINDQHYRYLKKLWVLLLKEENANPDDNKADADEYIINNVRNYGISIINYAVKDIEYLDYNVVGTDKQWEAQRENCPDIRLSVDKYGVINVMVGSKKLRFIVTCDLPYLSGSLLLPENTYIIAYDNNDADDEYVRSSVNSANIIPVSLRDITCVERIAIILRKEMLKQYVENTLFKAYEMPRILLPYYNLIATFITCIQIDAKVPSYIFTKYPIVEFNKNKWRDTVLNSDDYKDKSRMEQKKISDALDTFIDDYELYAMDLRDKLRCFDPDCSLQINSWQCDSLSYIVCSCGYVLDSSNKNRIMFYKKDSHFSPEEMGMNYLEIKL